MRELRDEIFRNRRELASAAERVGLAVAAAGTHPFSRWEDQIISPGVRYDNIVEELQQLARSLLIFGLHVHVGLPDRSVTIDLMNEVRYFLPHLLALSTSSPFWMGRDTGLKSYRTTIFRRFPRTGVPDHFESWSEYENYIQLLVDLHSIDDAKKIWWDVRPHPTFGTLEFRVCDVPTSPEAAVMLGALVQAIVVKLYNLRVRNQGFRIYRRALIEENKWRAARYGLDGKLIDFGRRAEVPMRDLALELLEFIDDVVDDLGSRKEVEYVHTVLRDGTSADQQLAVFRQDQRPQGCRAPRGSANAGWGELTPCNSSGRHKSSVFSAGASTAFHLRSSSASTSSERRTASPARWSNSAAPGWTKPARYRVIVDRISHEVEYYRGAMKHAVLQGTLRHQQPVLVDRRRQILQLLGDGQARRRHSADGAVAAEGLSG